jgi:hypothetical protein
VIQNVVCIECREVFAKGPDSCPFCNAVTFVLLNGNEDPNAICNDLVFAASLARTVMERQTHAPVAVKAHAAHAAAN